MNSGPEPERWNPIRVGFEVFIRAREPIITDESPGHDSRRQHDLAQTKRRTVRDVPEPQSCPHAQPAERDGVSDSQNKQT